MDQVTQEPQSAIHSSFTIALVGQPDAGTLTGDAYTLSGGFWAG